MSSFLPPPPIPLPSNTPSVIGSKTSILNDNVYSESVPAGPHAFGVNPIPFTYTVPSTGKYLIRIGFELICDASSVKQTVQLSLENNGVFEDNITSDLTSGPAPTGTFLLYYFWYENILDLTINDKLKVDVNQAISAVADANTSIGINMMTVEKLSP